MRIVLKVGDIVYYDYDPLLITWVDTERNIEELEDVDVVAEGIHSDGSTEQLTLHDVQKTVSIIDHIDIDEFLDRIQEYDVTED